MITIVRQLITKPKFAYTGGFYRFGVLGTHELTPPMRFNTSKEDTEENISRLPSLMVGNVSVQLSKAMSAPGEVVVSLFGEENMVSDLSLWIMADNLSCDGVQDYPDISEAAYHRTQITDH